MALHAVSTAPNKVVSSRISGFNMATSFINLVKVTPVVSQTSSKTGTLVWGRDIDGASSNVAERGDDDLAVKAAFWLKAEAPVAKLKIATEIFMFDYNSPVIRIEKSGVMPW